MFPHRQPPPTGKMDVRMLFDLEAARDGHRLLKYKDHHDNDVVACTCEEWQARIGSDDPNPGDSHEDVVDRQWPEHVIDSVLTQHRLRFHPSVTRP